MAFIMFLLSFLGVSIGSSTGMGSGKTAKASMPGKASEVTTPDDAQAPIASTDDPIETDNQTPSVDNQTPSVHEHSDTVPTAVEGSGNDTKMPTMNHDTPIVHSDTLHHEAHEHIPTITPIENDADQAAIEAYIAAVKGQAEMHMHGDNAAKMTEHMAAMDLVPRSAATHIAIKSGDWFDPDTWYNGEIPDADAQVLIPEGINIHYDEISDARLFTVRVDGTLDFATDVDSRMVFDTMIVSPTGKLVIGTQADPVDSDVTVDLIIANNGPIDTDWDPMLLSRGLVSHGEASIHGAIKDSHEKVIEDPMAGHKSVTFSEAPDGWQVGDTIVIAGTSYDGHKWDTDAQKTLLSPSEDEVRIITRIEGNKVYFEEALVHDHDTPRADLKTSVANYTRNVSIETEDAETAEVFERGHVMFMHSDNVDIRFAEFHELGRTDKSQESFDISDFDNPSYDDNVQGRYSLHMHKTGTGDDNATSQIIGNAVYGSPGWGFVQHDSNAILSNNASFDTFGAGYVAETGNEAGIWTDNIAIKADGVSWQIAKNTSILSATVFDTARGGDGFWFQGRLIEATDNVAASVNSGFVYFHRDGDGRVIALQADQIDHLGILPYQDEIRISEAPIRGFDGNETFAANDGLHIVKANPNQGHDLWSEMTDFTAWNVNTGAHLEYTSHYILRDFDLIAKDPTQFNPSQEGFWFGKSTSEIVIIDSTVDGFELGASLKKFWTFGNFDEDQHDYVFVNTEFKNVDTKFEYYDPNLDQILDYADLPNLKPDLTLDPLIVEGGVVKISGTKADTLGKVEFPGGSDNFEMSNQEVVNALESEGYFTTTQGKAYFLTDIYFTDRVTGETYFETHPVFIGDSTLQRLGKPSWQYSEAVNNGVQDIVTTPEGMKAGDEVLDKPIKVTIETSDPALQISSAQSLWQDLTSGQDVLDETMPDEHEHEMAELVM